MLFQKILTHVFVILHYLRLRIFIKNNYIKFAHSCSITTGVRIRATDGGYATFGSSVCVDRFADIHAKYGELSIGDRTFIGQFSLICACEKIFIGSDCLIAEHVTIRDQDHKFDIIQKTNLSGITTSPIEIGNNVWIGSKVTITKGVKIGNNSVVGANSVVTKDIPSNTVVAGAPASILRKIK